MGLYVVRTYAGHSRRALLSEWARCLRSGIWKRGDGLNRLYDPVTNTYCPLGVLMRALNLGIEPGDKTIPLDLLEVMVPYGKRSLTPNYAKLPPLMMARILKETGAESTIGTLATLHERGLSFNAAAIIVDHNFYYPDEETHNVLAHPRPPTASVHVPNTLNGG